MVRFVKVFFLLAAVLLAAEGGALGAGRSALQITLYDFSSGGENLAAVGRVPLSAAERRAKMYAFSPTARAENVPYNRDVFYARLKGTDAEKLLLGVRHEQIVENRCVAVEIREYRIGFGETVELYSDRGKIKAVMKLVQ